MSKHLSEMSLEELWQLFPIYLTEHNPLWQAWYQEEHNLLLRVLPKESIVRVSHIGSTAVPAIRSKPIVDILAETVEGTSFAEVREVLEAGGYVCMSEGERSLSFNMGYTPDGFAKRVFHLHLRTAGDNEELYFRDYLIDHPAVALAYENLKLALWKKFEHNRDAYTEGKSGLVKEYTQKAKELYCGRYGGGETVYAAVPPKEILGSQFI
jgi:GrpB-like predicted nucleotidyltransferase (UPF0157 family)